MPTGSQIVQLPTFAVRIARDGSIKVQNDEGQTVILNGIIQPGLSERDARNAAELLTPIDFTSKKPVSKSMRSRV